MKVEQYKARLRQADQRPARLSNILMQACTDEEVSDKQYNELRREVARRSEREFVFSKGG